MTCFHSQSRTHRNVSLARGSRVASPHLGIQRFSENLLEKSEKDGSELDIAVVVVVVVVADEARDEK